jgi:hypothetical protein
MFCRHAIVAKEGHKKSLGENTCDLACFEELEKGQVISVSRVKIRWFHNYPKDKDESFALAHRN